MTTPKSLPKPMTVKPQTVTTLTATPKETTMPVQINAARKSLITGITTAQPRNNSEYLTPGEYVLTITNVKEGVTRAPASRPFFVVEYKVLACEGEKAVKMGHNASHMIMLDNDSALRDIRGFLDQVLTEEELATLSDDTVAQCTGPEQILTGRTVQAAATEITTRKGTPFTRIAYYRPEPQV